MAIQNVTDGYVIPQTAGDTYNGDSSDQTYSINPALIGAGENITIIDQGGTNSIELVGGLEIASTKVLSDQVQITLTNGAVIDVRGADTFTFKTGQNLAGGDTAGTDRDFSNFAQDVLGVTVPAAGAGVVDGGAATVEGGDDAPVAEDGQRFTLTTNADNISGTDGDDSVSGVAGTIDQSNLAMGGGADTLNLTVSEDDDNAAFTATGLETVQLRATGDAAGGAGVALEFGDVAGLEDLIFRRMTEDLTISNLNNLAATLKVESTADADVDIAVNYDPAQVTGTADSASVTVENSTFGGNFDVNGVETIEVTAVGSDNDINIDGDDLESLTVAGAGDISIDVDGSVTTFDASSNTGGTTMVATAAADVTATGGLGDDTFNLGTTFDADDSIDGGEGTDTLQLTGAGGGAALLAAGISLSNVENLEVTTGANGEETLDLSRATFEAMTFTSAAATDDLTITNYESGTITLTDEEGGANEIDVVDVSLADARGSADALAITVTNADEANAFTVDDIVSADGGIETLTLNLVQGADVADASDVIIDDVSITGADLTLTGDADATAGVTTSLLNETVSAGDATGDLILNLGNADQTVTTGSGDDTIAFGGNLTTDDTVDGGDGEDTLTATPAAGTANATISNVETATFDFTTAGASINLGNTSGLNTLNLTGDENQTVAAVAGLAALNLAATAATGDDDVSVTFATGESGDLTATIGDTIGGIGGTAVAIGETNLANYAGTLTLASDGASNTINGFDANSATGLIINTTSRLRVTGDGDDDISATEATTVTARTTGADLVVDDDLIITEATSITLDADDGDLTITGDVNSNTTATAGTTDVSLSASGNNTLTIDTDLDVDHMRNVIMEATSGGDINVDGVQLAGTDADGDDIAVDFTLTTDDQDSTINFDTGTNSGAGVIDSITVVSGAGSTANVDEVTITNADTDVTITEIDASAAAGDTVINLTTSNDAVEITTGSGDATITTTTAADTVVLGSGDNTVRTQDGSDTITAGSGVDTIIAETIDDEVTVNSFDTDSDIVGIDLSVVNNAITQNLINGAGTTDVADFFGAVIQSDADGTVTLDAGTNILSLTDTFADSAAVLAAIDESVTFQNDLAATDEGLAVLWSDGSSTYLSVAVVDDITDADVPGFDAVNNMVELAGVSVDDLTADNFNFVA